MSRAIGALAAFAGHTVRIGLSLFRVLPGIVGPGCIVAAVWAVDWRAGLASLGIALVLLDRRF